MYKVSQPMKVIIQIPCFNEEESLPITLADLPRQLEGVDSIEWLVINDGSIDQTVEVARTNGVHHIISHVKNLGLAQAFISGINASIFFGADIIVNTDADNQYCAEDIQKLINPILSREAEYVIGTRPIQDIKHFSPAKKILQIIGSWVVRKISLTPVEDAPSGFRAITRNAAMHLHVFNRYSYTIETVIQAGRMNLPTISVPIRTNGNLRPSRLISSIFNYLIRSLVIIIRSFITYEPLRFFVTPGILLFMATTILGVRYLVFFAQGKGAGHVQSLLLALALFILGVAVIIIGLLADLIAVNRRLLEDMEFRIKELQTHFDNLNSTDMYQKIFSRAYLTYSIRSSPTSASIIKSN
jgi:glycosyltransferase involved in cell wall biosynthesis